MIRVNFDVMTARRLLPHMHRDGWTDTWNRGWGRERARGLLEQDDVALLGSRPNRCDEPAAGAQDPCNLAGSGGTVDGVHEA